ncbi:MAG TPA: tetratricopeptide repeat protein, partial [Arenicellales bacterium]|nr:tetratricopeptide repeat protein [Arenicellales bacterium]
MSLLMDALKQAERGRDEERNQDPLTPEVESKPLDNPPAAAAAPSQPLPQPAPAQTSESTQELSLQPAEPAAPRATGPETADSGTGIPVEASAAPVQAVVGDESGPAQEPAPTATARAEPAPEPEPASAPEPDPESGLQPESDVPQAEAVEPAATTSQSPVRAAQLLAAKRHRDRRSQRLWLISAALVLMVMAAGIALFGALPHPEDNSQMMLGLSESIAPVSEIDPDAQTSPQASASAAVPADVVPETATRAAVAAVVEGVYPDPEVTPAHPPEPAATSAPAAAPASQPAAADQTIRIRRSQRLPQLNSHLRQAYQAYQNGDYAGAQRIYDNILADRPQQRDARLGRAAVALQQGDRETARQHYAALLRLDPTDAAAHAALAGL